MFSNKGTIFEGIEIEDPQDLFKNTDFIGKGPNDPEPDIVGFGHIHTPCIVRFKNKTIFNPGSVGIPVEMLNSDINDPSNKFSTLASYIIIEGNYDSKDLGPISFNLVRLPYNIESEVRDIRESNIHNKDMIIESLTGALPTKYTVRSEKYEK